MVDLLLGVGFNRCNLLAYAESLTPNRGRLTVLPECRKRRAVWVEKLSMRRRSTHSPRGSTFADGGHVRTRESRHADALLFSTPPLVDFAAGYFRDVLTCPEAVLDTCC